MREASKDSNIGVVAALEYINSRTIDLTDKLANCSLARLAEIAEDYRQRGEGELFAQAGRIVLQS